MATKPSITEEQVLEFLKGKPELLKKVADENTKSKVDELTNEIKGLLGELKSKKKTLQQLCVSNELPYPFGRERKKG